MALRLGWGEFYRPDTYDKDGNEAVKWHARLQFLEAIDDGFPLKELLFDDVYVYFHLIVKDAYYLYKGEAVSFIPKDYSAKEAFRILNSWDSISNHIGQLPAIRPLTQEEKKSGANPNFDSIKEYIEKNCHNEWDKMLVLLAHGLKFWESFLNLGGQHWFCEMVIVLFWRYTLKKQDDWKLTIKHIQPALAYLPTDKATSENRELADNAARLLRNSKRLNFTTSDWNPIIETKEKAKARLKRAFALYLDKHFEDKSNQCLNIGYRKTPEKRNPLHFKWLVDYLFHEKDFDAIAQAYADSDPEGNKDVGTDAVRKAIVSTAELVGINLRK